MHINKQSTWVRVRKIFDFKGANINKGYYDYCFESGFG